MGNGRGWFPKDKLRRHEKKVQAFGAVEGDGVLSPGSRLPQSGIAVFRSAGGAGERRPGRFPRRARLPRRDRPGHGLQSHHGHAAGLRDAPGTEFRGRRRREEGPAPLTIDPRPFQAQLDSAQAQVVQSQASLDLAKVQFEMYAAVADTRAISKFDYNTRKSAVETGAAQLKAAEAAVETAKLNLEYCSIRSPVDGRAGKALVNAGNVVTANQTAILTIQQLAPLYVDFTITERDLPRVKELMAQGALKAFVWLPSEAEDAARDGEMNFLDNAVQNSTGTVGLRATLPNTDRHFWPGQFVRVRLVLETKKNAVLVPNRAPQISQKGPYVFVVKADGTAELRQVTLGQWQGDLVVIEQGLAAGESVVTTGQLAVNPGAKVQVEAPGAESPSPAGTGEKAAGKEAPSPAGTGAKAAGSAEPN